MSKCRIRSRKFINLIINRNTNKPSLKTISSQSSDMIKNLFYRVTYYEIAKSTLLSSNLSC